MRQQRAIAMAPSKKELQRQKEDALRAKREASRRVLEAVHSKAPVQYVISTSGAHESSKLQNEDEGDELTIAAPLLANPNDIEGEAVSKRKRNRVSILELKVDILSSFGDDAEDLAKTVDEYDVTAEDPLFTLLLKNMRNTVAVPSHWVKRSFFLDDQIDRDKATHIVSSEMELTDVATIRRLTLRELGERASGQDIGNFLRCFCTGSPLETKTFGVRLSGPGDAFEERKVWPKKAFTPGVISARLTEALGIQSPLTPPQWIRSIQEMKRLPPAYPTMRIPGVNAPLPQGARFDAGNHGGSRQEWGGPPRDEKGKFIFGPGVMGEVTATVKRPWGSVPKTKASEPAAQPAAQQTPPVAQWQPQAPPSAGSQAPAVTVKPQYMAAVVPPPLPPPNRAAPVREMELTRVADPNSIIAAAGTLLPKAQHGYPQPPPPLPPQSNTTGFTKF